MLLGTSFFSKEFSQQKYSLFIIQSAIIVKLTGIMQMSSHGSDVFYIFILLNYVKFPAPTVGVNVFFNIWIMLQHELTWGHPKKDLANGDRLAEPVHQGFFQLCEVGGLRTSKGGLREIWLEVRQQSQIFTESWLVLATLKDLLSKYGDSYPFFSLKIWWLLCFFLTDPFSEFTLNFILFS